MSNSQIKNSSEQLKNSIDQSKMNTEGNTDGNSVKPDKESGRENESIKPDNLSENKKNKKDRILWIDLAKGITIILVIMGHTIEGIGRGMIFSFHLPLFFILSCITFRYSKNEKKFIRNTERSFLHLIIPAYLMLLAGAAVDIYRNIEAFHDINYCFDYVRKISMTGIFASGVDVWINGGQVFAMGIPWFLVVLFGGRTLFDYLQLKLDGKNLIIVSVLLSIVGAAVGQIQYQAFSFDIALFVLPFFLVGKYFKVFEVEKKPLMKLVVYLVVWGLLFVGTMNVYHSYMELAWRHYASYPILYLVAVAGTLAMTEFCVLMSKIKVPVRPVSYLGKHSMWLLFIHHMDPIFSRLFWRSENLYINAVMRIAVDLIVFVIVIFAINGIKMLVNECRNIV